jgi:hypothetical protein
MLESGMHQLILHSPSFALFQVCLYMNIYMYVYIYINICIYVYVYILIYILIYIYILRSIYVYVYTFWYIFIYTGGIVHLLASLSVNYDLYPHDTIRLYLPGFNTEDGGTQGERFNLGVTMIGVNFTRSIWSPQNAYIDVIIGGGAMGVAILKNTMIKIDIQGSSGLFAPFDGLVTAPFSPLAYDILSQSVPLTSNSSCGVKLTERSQKGTITLGTQSCGTYPFKSIAAIGFQVFVYMYTCIFVHRYIYVHICM